MPASQYAPVIIRAFAATFLIYMSQDNVFSGARMAEFVRFLTQFGFPLPAVAAPVSVFAQFAAGAPGTRRRARGAGR